MTRLIITVSILSLSAIFNYNLLIANVNPDRTFLDKFPKTIEKWTMINQQTMDEEVLNLLKVDDYILRTYSDKSGNDLNLYIGYFQTQYEEKRIHSPNYCLPGGGWRIIEAREYMLSLRGNGTDSIPVQLNIVSKGSKTLLVLWWYQGRGRVSTGEYSNKFYLFWDAVTRNRTDGALVRIDMPITDEVNKTLSIVHSFLNPFLQLLPEYIPD